MPTFTPHSGPASTSLTSALLGPNPGIVIDAGSIQLSAADGAVNFYDGSLSPLGIGAGLLLTSGTTPGTSNTVGYFGADNSLNGDPLLDAVVNTVFQTQSFDATMLSFSFNVTDPAATSISFDLLFGSDEYPEWVDQFVDVAVVMVNGVNVALFNHDATHPLSVVSPNLAAGYFIDNGDGHLPIEYDGISSLLKIVAPVHAGTNTITIGIADTGDHIYDSGIFIANMVAGNIPGSGVVVTPETPCTDGNDDVTGSSKDEYFNLLGGDDMAYAGAGDDIVEAGAGNDAVYGGSGADHIKGDGGDDFIDGGDGDDTAVFSGASAGFSALYNAASNNFTVTDASAAEGVDTLTNVEFAQFSDGLYALGAGGLTLVTPPPPAATNTAGLVLISGIGSAGNTLTATVSDPDGVSGAVSYQWQISGDGGASWADIDGATDSTYTVSGADVGMDLQVVASYVDNAATPVAELAVSAPKAILETTTGDLVVTLMQLDAPLGTSTINPLTTLLKDAMALGLSPNMAALAIKTVLGLPAEVSLQHYDAWAVLQNDPANPTALAVEKVAVQVAILTSLSDDDTGMHLAVAIVDAALANQTLDLGNLDDLSLILGIPADLDPVTGKYPQPLDEIYDRNKTMSEALADGNDVSAIEAEWQDLLTLQDGINSTSIGDLNIHVNQAPQGIAAAVLPAGQQGASYTVTAADLLAGFTDPEGDGLAVQGLSADQGSVSTTDGLSFTVTFAENFSGPVELSYSVADGLGGSAPASQMFIVAATPSNTAPTGTADAVLAEGSEDAARTLTAADLLSGFTDADGDTLAVQGLSADHASVTALPDGTFLLNPDTNYHGNVTLSYQVVDGQGGEVSATLQLMLAAVNDAPVVAGAVAAAAATEGGAPVSVAALAQAS
ncbi:MAG: cadherin-like domain-containing protein, partial [Sphaerotilus sp.]|nr:cadherin-like domain-containing protein [Sphaerotilus sp.]